MGNENDRCAQLFLQQLDHVQHLRLNGDIQRCCWFIGKEQFRIAGKRHGDYNNAASFRRKTDPDTLKTFHGNADHFQHMHCPFFCLCAADLVVDSYGFGDLETNSFRLG